MAKKVTLASLKDMVRLGAAKEITPKSRPHELLNLMAYHKSPNAYCASGKLYQGDKTKKLYVVLGMENCQQFT